MQPASFVYVNTVHKSGGQTYQLALAKTRPFLSKVGSIRPEDKISHYLKIKLRGLQAWPTCKMPACLIGLRLNTLGTQHLKIAITQKSVERRSIAYKQTAQEFLTEIQLPLKALDLA